MIDITLLGTNALMPIPDRALTSALLACSGRTILFDCGEGTQTAARKAHVSLMKTDLIALTHYHGDHIFGLPGLLQTMNCLGRRDPLYITGPEGLQETLELIMQLVGTTEYPVVPIEIPNDGLMMRDLCSMWPREARLFSFETVHRVSSCGYRFELNRPRKFLADKADALGIPNEMRKMLQRGENVKYGDLLLTSDMVLGEQRKGLSFVFTGDTMADDILVPSCREADLLICDATYAENDQSAIAHEHGHMTFAEAATLAVKAEVKQLCLAHYSQMISDPEEYLENATNIFANTVCGYDGMKVRLNYSK